MLDPKSKELEIFAKGAILAVKRAHINKDKKQDELITIGKAVATYMTECGVDKETTARFCASVVQTFMDDDDEDDE